MEVVKRICDLCGADIQHNEDAQYGWDMCCIDISYERDRYDVDLCPECYKVVIPKVKALLKEHNTVGQL
jgi:hypothetical protein